MWVPKQVWESVQAEMKLLREQNESLIATLMETKGERYVPLAPTAPATVTYMDDEKMVELNG